MCDDAAKQRAAQLYMVMKGAERELKEMGFKSKDKPIAPIGVHALAGSTIEVQIVKDFHRTEGIGNGKEMFSPTGRALSLKTLCVGAHLTGFNLVPFTELIGRSIEASITGEVDKAMDAIPAVVAERQNTVLEACREHKTARNTKAILPRGKLCEFEFAS